ncbi:DUF484 family protein [Thiomicrorhabdus sp. Milos-T2]|uniref:DUF484 family protein n=1 Tax=Thiomicrorhabdus sp. Milos-T2 TaxID=90814 RepID=UPI000493C39A|nr:DUF484 family protein [Thiomicrorhabdus sp. Milos-T2]
MSHRAVTGPLSDSKVSAEEVVNYLSHNPKFFHIFPNLLDDLSIPHPKTGDAVSLLERQVFQLREQRDTLKIEVDNLVDVATENGQLFYKVQLFTKALMATQTEQDLVTEVYAQMQNLFEVDQVAMVSWDVPKTSLQGITQLGVSQSWSEALKTSLNPHKPICGLLENEWQNGLFHTEDAMQSVCLLPMGVEAVWGVLALGSKTNRFHPDLGTYFLNIMAELIGARLNHLFEKS